MDMLNDPGWYIVYTKPDMAKKVADRFSRKKIEHYFPMKRVNQEEFGRLRTIYKPLFAFYVFVHVAPVDHSRIKRIKGVVSLVHWLEKPAIIPKEAIDSIKHFLNLYTDVMLEKIPVCFESKTIVIKDSIIPEEDFNYFVKEHLPCLGYTLKAWLNPEFKKTANILVPNNDQQLIPGKFSAIYPKISTGIG
jgi:transcription antitermination factor NusG